jgi:nicotinate-nucleotide adenylyltransferase
MIGVLGGTFDPPHLAHIALAEVAFEQMHLEKVLWVPAADPPHKTEAPSASLKDRITMVQMIVDPFEYYELSHADIERPPPYFSYGTMEWLRERHPGTPMAYLMGSDSLRDLPRWGEPQRFLDSCDALGVMVREEVEVDMPSLTIQFPGLGSKVHWLPTMGRAISARDIRRRIAAGLPVQDLLTPEIAAYIRRHDLYRSG